MLTRKIEMNKEGIYLLFNLYEFKTIPCIIKVELDEIGYTGISINRDKSDQRIWYFTKSFHPEAYGITIYKATKLHELFYI